MKKVLMTTVALAFVTGIPLSAIAANVSIGTGVSVGVSANAGASGLGGSSGEAEVASAGSGSGSAAADVDAVLQAFAVGQAVIEAVANVGESTPVQVMRVGTVLDANSAALGGAEAANTDATAALQAAIDANADLRSDLEAEGIAVSSIVAADVDAGGTLTLYSDS